MIYEIYTVLDKKTNAYSQPYFFFSENIAKREFTTLVNSEGNQLNAHPHDYHLCHCGQFDDDSGKFITEQKPYVILSMNELVDEEKRFSMEHKIAQLEFSIKKLEKELKNSKKAQQPA